jgi:hypothetical protein
MAKILIVHGISNQFVGESELLAAWYPALCDGLRRAGSSPLPAADDCFCPFYGDLFRPVGHLSTSAAPDEEDLADATDAEAQLLKAVWESAAAMDAAVPGPAAYGETLFRAPRIAERALNALAKSKYLADYLPLRFFGDLKQVDLYMNDVDVRRKVLERVTSRIDKDTQLVIGHSLGSVAAYEAVCRKPELVCAFLTVGSPLGIRNVVFDKLHPPPDGLGLGRWPGTVSHWTNVAAVGDIVAAQKKLAPLFGNNVEDVVIDSGWDAHSSTRYLNSIEAGRAVARALAA